MKRSVLIVPAVLAALSLTTSAWAGGSMCSKKSEGASKEAGAGAHCTPGVSATSKEQCAIGADNAVYSFAVQGAHCDACVTKIQSAAMAQKGVLCARVNLDTKTAYVAGAKNMDRRVIAKAIKDAGFRCAFKAQGPKVRAE
ncbi:MAG TPA: heavy metal-associated domain-containing protein, partial [Candidatus Eisenbacteria bacterium]|nr:heavy metal-associated domain-containing protein [Candidatus Eisenbacteria bacterium]